MAYVRDALRCVPAFHSAVRTIAEPRSGVPYLESRPSQAEKT